MGIKSKVWGILLILCISVLTFYLFRNSFGMTNYQQFSYLAKSFLEGSLSFTQSYDGWWHDAVLYQEGYYWPLGPLPAILLMPFQLFANIKNVIFYQGYLHSFLVVILFGVVYKLSQKFDFNKLDSLYLTLGFTGATTFLGVAMWPNSWFFAQVVTTLLIFLSFLEYIGRKRYWIIGILFGLVLATRFTASLGIFFFVLEIFFSNKSIKAKMGSVFRIVAGFLPFVILIGVYNFVRFGNFLEQGYSYQNVAGVFSYVKEFGLFNTQYIFSNLYYMIVNPPVLALIEGTKIVTLPFLKADPWGMGLIFTSPIIIFTLLSAKWREQASKLLLITSVIISLPILLYYGIGWYQFGYRYSLDFLPFLFLLLLYNTKAHYKTLPASMKLLIVGSALLNMYLFNTIFIL